MKLTLPSPCYQPLTKYTVKMIINRNYPKIPRSPQSTQIRSPRGIFPRRCSRTRSPSKHYRRRGQFGRKRSPGEIASREKHRFPVGPFLPAPARAVSRSFFPILRPFFAHFFLPFSAGAPPTPRAPPAAGPPHHPPTTRPRSSVARFCTLIRKYSE